MWLWPMAEEPTVAASHNQGLRPQVDDAKWIFVYARGYGKYLGTKRSSTKP